MSKGTVVVFGTLAGFAIGAITGILFAPEKGSVTRKQIVDQGEDYMDELKSKFDELRDSLARILESTKKDAENIAEKGEAKFEDTEKDVKNAASSFKHSVS